MACHVMQTARPVTGGAAGKKPGSFGWDQHRGEVVDTISGVWWRVPWILEGAMLDHFVGTGVGIDPFAATLLSSPDHHQPPNQLGHLESLSLRFVTQLISQDGSRELTKREVTGHKKHGNPDAT